MGHLRQVVGLSAAVIIAINFFALGNAAVSIQPPLPKPPGYENQEGCWSDKKNMVLAYDVNYPGDDCTRLICRRDNNTIIESCGTAETPPAERNCVNVQNFNADYPDCCVQYQCPQNS